MFHQANMRVADVPTTTINGKTGQYSLLMSWLEVVTTEMTRMYVKPCPGWLTNADTSQHHMAYEDAQARRHCTGVPQPPDARPLQAQYDLEDIQQWRDHRVCQRLHCRWKQVRNDYSNHRARTSGRHYWCHQGAARQRSIDPVGDDEWCKQTVQTFVGFAPLGLSGVFSILIAWLVITLQLPMSNTMLDICALSGSPKKRKTNVVCSLTNVVYACFSLE
jgi:hypothetical protein